MTDPRQFGAGKPTAGPTAGKERSNPLDCAAVELWLAESAEEMLPPTVAEQLHAHARGCAACQEKLAQARRGREWLLVLKQESVEPPVGLVAKILAQTSLAGTLGAAGTLAAASDTSVLDIASDASGMNPGAGDDGVSAKATAGGKRGRNSKEVPYIPGEDPAARSIPAWQHSSVVVLRRTFIEPRLALVAAMAFFSIALTLNLMGVRLTSLHAADLAPRNMHRAVTRQYVEANARVVRYYENLRIVYEVEARVQQLRRAAETSTPPEQKAKPRKQSSDVTGDSTGDSSQGAEGSRRGPLADNPLVREDKHTAPPALPDPKPVMTGPETDVALRWPLSTLLETTPELTLATFFVAQLVFRPAPLASSCSLRTACFSMRYFSTRERRLA
jgi:hypothetical protein